jgi:hypothetical protein
MLRWNASQVNKGLGPLLRNDAWYGDGYVRNCQGDDYECEEFRALASWVYVGFVSIPCNASFLLILTSSKPTNTL